MATPAIYDPLTDEELKKNKLLPTAPLAMPTYAPPPGFVAPAAAVIPKAPGQDLTAYDLPAGVKQNVDWLMKPGNTYDVDQKAAEANLGRGTAGSQFGAANTYNLRDQDRIQRIEAGNKLLEPYVARYHEMKVEDKREAAALAQIAMQGEQALKQIAAEFQGKGALQTQAERAEAERQVTAGKQALEQLAAKAGYDSQQEAMRLANAIQLQTMGDTAAMQRAQLATAGESERQRAQLAAELARTQMTEGGATARSAAGIAADLERARLSEAGAQSRLQSELAQRRYETNLNLINSILSKYGVTGGGGGGGTRAPAANTGGGYFQEYIPVPLGGMSSGGTQITGYTGSTGGTNTPVTYSGLPNFSTLSRKLGLQTL